jgi:hypothetical protein
METQSANELRKREKRLEARVELVFLLFRAPLALCPASLAGQAVADSEAMRERRRRSP